MQMFCYSDMVLVKYNISISFSSKYVAYKVQYLCK